MNWHFTLGGQCIGASTLASDLPGGPSIEALAVASVLPVNIQC